MKKILNLNQQCEKRKQAKKRILKINQESNQIQLTLINASNPHTTANSSNGNTYFASIGYSP